MNLDTHISPPRTGCQFSAISCQFDRETQLKADN